MSCTAKNHGTVKAARVYGCICPRALKALGVYQPMPAWWTGPWRILKECPASGHNVLRRIEKPIDGVKCICPRAKELYVKNLEQKRALRKRQKVNTESRQRVRILSVKGKNRSYAAPDWTRATCHEPWMLPLVDSTYEAKGMTQGPVFAEMKKVCRTLCPLQEICLGWAFQEEIPGGSWGGIWGGLDPQERRRAYLLRGSRGAES